LAGITFQLDFHLHILWKGSYSS